MVIPSVNISIELYLVLCILWTKSRSLIGLFICLHWSMLTMLHLTVLQGFNHMSSCLGVRLQCLAIISLGSGITRQSGLKSKTAWLSQQLNALVSTNKQALKLIHKTTQCNKAHVSRKQLLIPVGNHVLLQDHPKGRNKIQDRYKSDVYIVIGHHHEPNMYYVQLLNKDCKGHPKVVNHHQIYDLNRSSPPLESSGF